MTALATRAIDEAPGSSVLTDSYEYDAFGNSFTVSGSTPNNYLYRGEQYDPDPGLYYLRARYYNPATGRFAPGRNLYAVVDFVAVKAQAFHKDQ